MVQFYMNEEFREITLGSNLQLRYAISNYGRLASFTDEIKNGRILKGSKTEGYRIVRYKVRDQNNEVKNKHAFFYKLVAEYFLEKTSEEQVYVLHLDRNRANDHISNLRWATKEEMIEHSKASPIVKAARIKQVEERKKSDGVKLKITQVMFLKRRLQDPNRKIKMKTLANQFGITTMTLYRIKSGEIWGHVEV